MERNAKKIEIHLEKVTYDNIDAVRELRVAKDQRDFVASNDWSLIQAYLSLDAGEPVYPFAICNGKKVVGFIMINYANKWGGYKREAWLNSDAYRFYKDRYYYYIWRFMIDKKYQNRGYGREALKRAIEFIKTAPCGKAEFCVLSYDPKNEVAKKLYFSLGFEELNGPGYYEEDDEISAVLKL